MTREEINRYISKLEEKIKLASIATRLRNNPDFNSVFIKEYFGTYPLSLVKELSQHTQGSEAALIIEDKLRAISHTEAFLNTLIEQGQLLESELSEIKAIPDSELYQ